MDCQPARSVEENFMPQALVGVIQRLRKLASLPQAAQLSDRELLERFVRRQDETAFTALVERHAAMVLRTCRRVLRHHQDAEDACQATFLVLVRKASSIRKLNSVASWLHGVAFRVALKARSRSVRVPRPAEDLQTVADPQQGQPAATEWGSALDEELQRLPEKFRAPLILCYLQAKTRDEATQELGWKASTFKGRLEWGRKLLRQRLARRGLTWSAVLLAAAVGPAAVAAVPAPLAIALVQSALQTLAGKTPAANLVPAQVASLTRGFLRALLLQQMRTATAVMLLVLCLAGAGWFAVHEAVTTTAADTSPTEVALAAPSSQAHSPVLAAVATANPDNTPPLDKTSSATRVSSPLSKDGPLPKPNQETKPVKAAPKKVNREKDDEDDRPSERNKEKKKKLSSAVDKSSPAAAGVLRTQAALQVAPPTSLTSREARSRRNDQ
jgi:RNA polymerase sigma factor (sigma-70 family)